MSFPEKVNQKIKVFNPLVFNLGEIIHWWHFFPILFKGTVVHLSLLSYCWVLIICLVFQSNIKNLFSKVQATIFI